MELLDVYDDNGKKTGRVVVREDKQTKFAPGEHIAVSIIFIENSKGEFLIQKTSKEKGGLYSSTGGHIDKGEDPFDVIIRETEEEIGLDISKENIVSLGFRLLDFPVRFLYYLEKDIDINKLKIDKNEVEYVEFMSVEKINKIIDDNLMNKGHALLFNEILKYKGEKNEQKKYQKKY